MPLLIRSLGVRECRRVGHTKRKGTKQKIAYTNPIQRSPVDEKQNDSRCTSCVRYGAARRVRHGSSSRKRTVRMRLLAGAGGAFEDRNFRCRLGSRKLFRASIFQ